MSYLNGQGLQDLWSQIDDFFARLTEAGGSIQFDGETLTLHAITGGQLGAGINLHGYFPKTNEAAGSITFDPSSNKLRLLSVSGPQLGNDVTLAGDTNGLMAASMANDRFGSYLQLAGKRLSLMDYNGNLQNYVDLP